LHRHLLRQPALLPKGANLLLAVSGGQDSMALTGLMRDLAPLHGWTLVLWHGDHGWRAEGAMHAEALAAWAAAAGLALAVEKATPAPATEAEARLWRYRCLRRRAEALGCSRVLTAHTASDRAETVLLNLARGCHRRGLATLRTERPLGGGGVRLVRPLLPFDRQDTARICQDLAMPVWLDASNADLRFSRNRVRAEVLPVLEDLHPGAAGRIAALAERLAQEDGQDGELLDLAATALAAPPREGATATLARRALTGLQLANQRRVVQRWLHHHWGHTLDANSLERLLARLPPARGPGRQDLAKGWRLCWDGSGLHLLAPPTPIPHGPLP
jgi:tRNA(Ile)-lysidine synthase